MQGGHGRPGPWLGLLCVKRRVGHLPSHDDLLRPVCTRWRVAAVIPPPVLGPHDTPLRVPTRALRLVVGGLFHRCGGLASTWLAGPLAFRLRLVLLQRLRHHCGPQHKPLVVTALRTGFRKSELLSLPWADVDFRRWTITVRAAYAKNGESRSVPMNDVLTATLKAVRMNALYDLVFCSHKGTPYRSFRSAFEQAVRKAGIEDFTFHDLRHTFASRLVMAGVDLPTVKELMGHKDITMTLRYTHLSTDHK